MGKKKILIVDDEPNIIKMIEVRLKANNYDVVTASDGAEGMECVKKEHPDLIILDVVMPGVDGFQFFKTIKKDPAFAPIPVLMLTARGAMKDTFEALGAEEFITKPFESEDLMQKVNSIFRNGALLLSNDPYVTEKVGVALSNAGFEVTTVADEEAMVEKGREAKYKMIVAHMRFMKKEPADFAMCIRMMRERKPAIILYIDSAIKTKEQDESVAMMTMKDKWTKAGVEYFYDSRATSRPFSELLKTLVV